MGSQLPLSRDHAPISRDLVSSTLTQKQMKRKFQPARLPNSKRYQAYVRNQNEASRISQIAKKVFLGQAETKAYISEGTQNIPDNGGKFQNLNYGVTTGGGFADRIGQRIYLTSIRLKGQFYSNTTSNTATKVFRLIIIKKSTSLGTTTGSIVSSDIFRTGSTGVLTDAMLNTDKTKVLYDKTMTVTPTYGATQTQLMLRPFEFLIPIGQKESFTDAGTSELQGGSYFLVMCAYDGNGVVVPGGFNYAWSFNFKDE